MDYNIASNGFVVRATSECSLGLTPSSAQAIEEPAYSEQFAFQKVSFNVPACMHYARALS